MKPQSGPSDVHYCGLWQEGNLILQCGQKGRGGEDTWYPNLREDAGPAEMGEAGSARGLKGQSSMPSGQGGPVSGSASPSLHTARWPQGPEAASWRRACPEGSPRHTLFWRGPAAASPPQQPALGGAEGYSPKHAQHQEASAEGPQVQMQGQGEENSTLL